MGNLYQKFATIEDKMSQLEEKLQLPQRRNLLVRTSVSENRVNVYTDLLLNPKPHITKVPLKLMGMPFGNITVSQTDYLVEVSRTQLINLFIKEDLSRATFIIDPPLVNGEIEYSNSITKEISGGIKCKLIHVLDDDPVILKLILTRNKDK